MGRAGEGGRREDGAGPIAAVGTSSSWAMRLRLRLRGMMSLLGSEPRVHITLHMRILGGNAYPSTSSLG